MRGLYKQKQTVSYTFGRNAEALSSDQGRFHGVLEKPEVSFPVPAALFRTILVKKQFYETYEATAKIDLVSIWLGLSDRSNSIQLRLHEQQ